MVATRQSSTMRWWGRVGGGGAINRLREFLSPLLRMMPTWMPARRQNRSGIVGGGQISDLKRLMGSCR